MFQGELIGLCGPTLSITPALRASVGHPFAHCSLLLACQMQAVGITSSLAVPSHRLSASSSRDRFEPDKARLHGDGAWSPSDDVNPTDFLQVDLQYDFFICAVATQGNPSSSFWTTKYRLLFSVNGIDWLTYKENGKDKVCIAITTNLNPFFSGRIWRHSYQTDTIFLGASTKTSRHFMIRLHNQVFLDEVNAPSNNAVINSCRTCNITINNMGHDAGTVTKIVFRG